MNCGTASASALMTAFFLVMVGGVVAVLVVQPAAAQSSAPVQTGATGQTDLARAVTAQLTPERAIQIAQSAVPRAVLTRAPELVNFQGTVAYEVVLDRGALYIDASNSTILFNGAANAAWSNRGEREHEEHEENDDD
jgi:hypothetical protein